MTSYNTNPPGTPSLPAREPVAAAEAFRLLLVAVLIVLDAFNVADLTDGQVAAILGVYAALSVVASVVTRRKVTPV